MTNTRIGEYQGTEIYVDADGIFNAMPAGARKRRIATSLNGLRAELDTFYDKQKQARRVNCSLSVRVFRDGKVETLTYLGTRGKATKTHEQGHAFNAAGHPLTLSGWAAELQVIPENASYTNLLLAHAAMVQAKKDFEEQLAKATVHVRLPRIPYYTNSERLDEVQSAAVEMLNNAKESVSCTSS